jgi:hypothetical protein
VQTEPAHGNIDGAEPPEHLNQPGIEPDFFAGLTKRRALERLAVVDDTARQGNLAAVPGEVCASYGQDGVRSFIDRNDQKQSGGVPDVRDVEPGRPRSWGAWHETFMACRSREGAIQRSSESRDRIGIVHAPTSLQIWRFQA